MRTLREGWRTGSGRGRPGRARRGALGLAILLALGACGEPEARRLDTLVQRDGRYLDPDDFEPYTGPVVSVFRNAPDAVEMTARLESGRLDGPYERFYRSGALFSRGRYEAGAWDGPFESFYEDGSAWMSGRYEDGVLEGPYVAYAEDGTVEEEGTYEDGEPCGTWTVEGETVEHPPCS